MVLTGQRRKKETISVGSSMRCCFFVVCVLLFWCVCVCGAQTAHTSHPLYSVSLWVICMSLQLCFISEWLLRKLLHKTPVKMEEGSNTDLKKPRAFSIFSPYVVDEKCVWERERAQMSFLLGLTHLLGFLMTAKFMQSHFSCHFLSPPSCCSPSVLPLFTHLGLAVWALVWSPSVKDDTTVGRILTCWAQDRTGYQGSLCIQTVPPWQFSCVSVLVWLSVLPVLSIPTVVVIETVKKQNKHICLFFWILVIVCSVQESRKLFKNQMQFQEQNKSTAGLHNNTTQKSRMSTYLHVCFLVKGETLLLMKHHWLECETWFQLRVRVGWFGV